MEEISAVGLGFWEVLKIIFSIILNHLPYFLAMLFAGLLLGFILAFFITRFCAKKGLFKRPKSKKGYRILVKGYQILMFLSLFLASTTLFTWLATGSIVKKEIHHGVDSSFQFIENHYLKEESVRQDLYQKAEFLLKGGMVLKSVNQAVGESAIQMAAAHEDANFFVRNFSGFIGTSFIEDKLLEYEKGLLFYMSAMAIDHMGMNVEGIYSYELFEQGFDTWYNLEWDHESVGIKKSITHLIYRSISPAILSLFLPFFLIFLACILIPLLDFFIYSRKKRMDDNILLEE